MMDSAAADRPRRDLERRWERLATVLLHVTNHLIDLGQDPIGAGR
jgi:hypothetical protein